MSFLCTLIAGALGSYSPMPSQEGYGVGVWVGIGTPATRYFLTPDLGASRTKLFSDGDLPLMPYFEPRAPSSSWRESEDGTFHYDKLQLANALYESVPIEFNGRYVSPMDRKHIRSSHGRLGLGPESVIAKSQLVELRRAALDYGGDEGVFASFALAQSDTLPEIPSSHKRSIFPIVPRSDGWFLKATLNVNGQKGSKDPVDIAIDINAYPILIPKEDIQRLVVVLRLQQPHGKHTHVTSTGQLMVPCDFQGKFLVNLDAFVSVVSGGKLELDLPTSGVPEAVNPDTNHLVCTSPFEVNMYDGEMMLGPDGAATLSGGEWRINPLLIRNLRSVFLDARDSRLIFDTTPVDLIYTLPSGPVLGAMLFGRPRLELNAGGAFLVFPRASGNERGYGLESRFPKLDEEGSWKFSFICTQPVELGQGPGRLGTRTFRDHQFEIPEEHEFMIMKHSGDSLRLRLIRVDPNQPMTRSSRPRYSLTVTTGESSLMVTLRPVTHNSHNRVHADRIQTMVKEVMDDFKRIGMN